MALVKASSILNRLFTLTSVEQAIKDQQMDDNITLGSTLQYELFGVSC